MQSCNCTAILIFFPGTNILVNTGTITTIAITRWYSITRDTQVIRLIRAMVNMTNFLLRFVGGR